MIVVLRLLHWPFWKRLPLAAVLPSIGVALGVGTIVAVDLAGASAVHSFRQTVERIDGRTTHRVVGGSVPHDLARRLAEVPGVEAAAPVMEAVALVPAPSGRARRAAAGEPLRLLGIDPLSEGTIRSLGLEQAAAGMPLPQRSGPRDPSGDIFREFLSRPGALVVSPSFLDRHRLTPGDDVELVVGARRSTAHVLAALPEEVGGLEVPDNLAVADIATVQELSARFEGVSRVDLVIPEPGRAGVVARVRALLPEGTRVERPGREVVRLERGLAAFQANIRALSYLALFVSFFLIYDSLLLAVLRRRPLLGIARCLGATRGQVLAGWLGEALITGAAGIAGGLALGILFAEPALRAVSRTARDLYGGLEGGAVNVDPAVLVKAGVLGLAFTLISALVPALEAAATPPAHLATRSAAERSTRRRRRSVRIAAVALGGAIMAALAWPTSSPAPGYLAAIGVALLVALLVPDVVELALRLTFSRRGKWAAGVIGLAAANIRANLSRTGVAVAALTIALSMSAAMGTLIRSFRLELVDWIERSVRADVYVSPLGMEVDRTTGALLPEDLEARLAALPEVAAVDSYRGGPALVKGRETMLGAIDVSVLRERVQWPVLAGGSSREFFDELAHGSAGVSEPLARKAGIRPGDRIGVLYEGTLHELPVAGVYRDYSTDRGVVLVDRAAFARRHRLGAARSLALYLRPGADAGATVSKLQSTVGSELALLVRSNRELRERALTVFERTFSIARVMQGIGLTVAVIGILSALLAMLLERGRELAILRALGLTRRQLAGLFLGEATLLGLLAWILATATGAVLAWILIDVINVRSFGWALEYRLPWTTWAGTLAASLAASWAATLWPLRRLSRLRLAPLLREE